LDINADELEVLGDNWGSMSFSRKKDNYIFYYDADIVGDACPSATLYLVIDENELPNKIIIYDDDNNAVEILKDDIVNIKNMFINEIYEKYEDKWPFKELDKLSVEGNKIVDIKIVGQI
jgi:hypothetical protein